MKVIIDKKTVCLINKMLNEESKEVVRIKNCGVGCGGFQFEIIMDELKPDDDIVVDNNIKIVADKSFSFYLSNALITHKDGIFGPRLKIKPNE